MGLIPESVIEEVLARTDILETVRQYVSLKRAGQNYKGLCPFHDENTPSFFVHPGMGIYKCFGCGEGGNVYQFLMSIEGWNFPETVRHLADRCGVEVPEQNPEEAEEARRRREGKKLYYEIMEAARDFYCQKLWGDEGTAARMYLEERGISEETAEAFGLGYAPDGWEHLLGHLSSKGYRPEVLKRAGLVMANDRGGYYDRFRHRIVFPVVDVWGHTLAFGGRTLAADDEGAKYINSPETAFYTKGEQLYGLDVAKRSIQDEGSALLVEGNFDVMALHDVGLETTVAPMGTALSEGQARLIGRFARQVVVAFDGDDAGRDASLRCLSALQKAGLEARVIRFGNGEDPDTFVRREGAEALHDKIDEAKPLIGWALDLYIVPVEGASIEARIGVLDDIAEILNDVEDNAVKEHYVEEVARRLNIEPGRVSKYLSRPEKARRDVAQELKEVHQRPEWSSAAYGVLVVLLDEPEWLEDFFREELDKLLASRELATLLDLARDHYDEHGTIDGSLLLESIDRPPLRETVSRALADSERDELYPPDQRLRWYRDCVWTLKRRWAQRMAEYLENELEQVDFSNDRQRFETLTRQLDEVRQFQQALDLEGVRAERLEGRAG